MAGFTRRNVRLRDLSSYLWKVACVAGMKRGIEGGRAGMEAGGGVLLPYPFLVYAFSGSGNLWERREKFETDLPQCSPWSLSKRKREALWEISSKGDGRSLVMKLRARHYCRPC